VLTSLGLYDLEERMRRTDLQAFAQVKADDALLLLQHQRWSSAYYLAGYAIELGLKACIARQIAAETIPDTTILKNFLTHQYLDLVGLAGLRPELKQEQDVSPAFAANWGVVGGWGPETRYQSVTTYEAQLMLEAVCDSKAGVLQWIKRYW
jgi:hypothetical protein